MTLILDKTGTFNQLERRCCCEFNKDYTTAVFQLMYVLYLIALVILLMNLLIAVLNTTYANCIENATRRKL